MSKDLHVSPLHTLARNLRAAMDALGLSARAIGREADMSNKTVSSMLKAEYDVRLGNAAASAEEVGVPLWQLLCPAIPANHFGDKELHELIENYANASPDGRRQIRRTAQLEALANAGQTGT